MNIKKIFSKKIAIELLCRKHNLIYTEQNHKKDWLSVFCFEKTDELLKDLTEISSRS